jgi:hypothetical protein
LFREIEAIWVIPQCDFELLSTHFQALGKGRNVLLCGVLVGKFLVIWMARKCIIEDSFWDYEGVHVEGLWDQVHIWSAL